MPRFLIAASILLASVASCDSGSAQAKPWSVLLNRFSDDVWAVRMGNQRGHVTVELYASVPDGVITPGAWIPERLKSNLPKRMADRNFQVWVLRRVGTALAQIQPPTVPVVGSGNGGWSHEHMDFQFENAEQSELAGVVVWADGKIYSQEMPPADSPTQRGRAPNAPTN
jgi:hypothetical protein